MKTFHYLITACVLLLISTGNTFGQTAASLIKEGVQLHDAEKYAEAIGKYQQALKLEPNNLSAEFEMSFSMNSSGRGAEAVPHLDKVIKGKNTELAAQACDVLGNYYDDDKQVDKAMAAYRQGLQFNPKYQRLWFNMTLCLVRQHKYVEGEASAIEAIKLEPKHAGSQKLYGLALDGQNKKAKAIIAYCSYLLLEPQGDGAIAVNEQLQTLITSSYKKTDEKDTGISMPKGGDETSNALELSLSMIALNASQKKDQTATALLQDELTTLFKTAAELSTQRKDNDFFWKYEVDFFGKLANTEHMGTFTRFITISNTATDNFAWLKEHSAELKALSDWVNTTPRPF